MAWDSKASRRGQNGSANAAVKSSSTLTPKSSHLDDPLLQPFLAPLFDPADFLNSRLPPLQSSSGTAPRTRDDSKSLAELSSQTQTLLSTLSANTARLTSTLTSLTDDILRSGSRLAYEVEVLRGDTLLLSEALTEGLHDDVMKFVPGGVEQNLAQRPAPTSAGPGRRRSSTQAAKKTPENPELPAPSEPAYIDQLRTLTSVRDRLDSVVKTFGDAMSWTFPPSEVSVTSSFLSVSAPEPGSEAHSTEEKGHQVLKKLRDEITDLLKAEDDPVGGVEAATKRVQELQELAKVWKGTAEEKARNKFVDSLAKAVEDRHRELLQEAEQSGQAQKRVDNVREGVSRGTESSSGTTEGRFQGGYGFINQLQKIRGGL